MTPMRFWHSPTFRWSALLGGALLWRLLLFVGAQGSDDLAYSEAAWTIASGKLPLDQGIHGTRIGYVGVIGGFYALFGAGSFSLILLNLLASVGEVALARLVAREFLDDEGAWLAACFVALLPVHVFHATEAHPDMPAAALVTLSAFLFLRAKASDRAGLFLLSGVALGAAHLMKEASFLGLAALAALGGRPRLRFLLPVAGFAAVLACEAIFFWTVAGDPLYRVHRVSAMQSAIMNSEYYLRTAPTFRRAVIDVPSMFFWPAGGSFMWFSLLPLLAVTGAGLALKRREAPLHGPILWAVSLTALITFWPISVAPYRPAMVVFPRIFLVAAVPMAILAAFLLQRCRPKISGLLFAAAAIASLGSGLLLHSDARRISAAARLAHPQTLDLPVVSDPRTIQFLRLYDGYGPRRPLLSWEQSPPAGGHYRIFNAGWVRNLLDWSGISPPAGFLAPGVAPMRVELIPGRVRPSALLRGRIERTPAEELRIYRLP